MRAQAGATRRDAGGSALLAGRPGPDPLSLAAALLLVSAIGAAALVAGIAEADPLPLAILAAAALLPVALFAGLQALRWREAYAIGAAVVIVILLCATFRIREITDKSVDFQILLRLAGIAAMAVLTAASLVVTDRRRPLGAAPLWIAFLAFAMATSAYSFQPAISLVETFSHLAAFAFVCAFHRTLGGAALVRALVAACFVLCCLSVAAYLAVPKLGRMSDWVNGMFIPTSRLSGVFGTANGAGAAAGLGILLTVLLSGLSWRRPAIYVILAPMLVCLVASHNRMSLAALAVCLAWVWVRRGEAALKLALILLAVGFGVLAMSFFGEAILESVSRSGSAEEITSGTGRTRIWAVVLDLWAQQPLFGYGEGSAKFILPVHPLLFEAAAHAHNLYLNILFAGGAIGLGLFLAALASTIRRAFGRGHDSYFAVLLFPLFYGLTEPTLGGLASFGPICFYAMIVMIHAPRRVPGPGTPAGRRARPEQ